MKINQPKKNPVTDILAESENIQEELLKSSYVHHDHGGREHGHDWDDWLKAEREMKPKNKKNR